MAASSSGVLDVAGPVRVEPIWSLPRLLAGDLLVQSEGADLRIQLPRFPGEFRSGELAARLEEPLSEVTRPLEVSLTLEREGRSAVTPVHLLPPWSFVPGSRPWSLLALVLPDEDEVTRLAAQVDQRAGEDAGVEAVLGALFEALSGESITLEPPRIRHHPLPWQEIGPPWRVLGPARPRRATCLDLTLLAAGVLEALGLAPLVLLEGDETGHAWLGVDRTGPGWRPWVREAPPASLLALELTEACTGRASGYEEAVRLGRDRLAAGRPLEILDVRAGRPPQGRIRPLQVSADAVCARALAAARAAGDRRGARHRESLHLLLGLLEAEGDLVSGLLGEAAGRVRDLIEELLPDEASPDPPAPTANWSLCVETARILARNRGSRVVQEGDLLRSVLQSPSPNIADTLRDGGIDPGELRLRLETAWPRVREETRVRGRGGRS